jgi:hypothetical protein
MTEDLLILGELIAEQAAHMDAAEHRLLTNIRELDRREGWASASSCAHWLSWRVGWTLGTARERVRVAKALASLPQIDEALRLGKVSYCKVRAMTRVATPANEQVLLMDAQLTSASQLERICRKYRQVQRNMDGANPADDDAARYLRRRDLDNGMVRIEAMCHPEEAALIWAAIEHATKELCAARQSESRSEAAAPAVSIANVSAETCTGAAGSAAADRARNVATVPAAVGPAEPQSAEVSDSCDSRHRVSAETCADANTDDACDVWDATTDDVWLAAEYEADCAYFERFGVSPEPMSRDRDLSGAPRSPAVSATATEPSASTLPRSTATATAAEKHAATSQFNRLDGLLALMRKYAMGESAKSPVEVVVTVSAEALANRAAPEECIAFLDDDGCISAETARRLSCDAGIVSLVEDEHGNPLSVGRRTRSIPPSIGRALRKRDKCCRFPGCTNRVYVDGHHLKHWALGGETALPNLVLLCKRHHTFVHEYGYRVEMDAAGTPQFFDPQGRPAKDIPPPIVRDDLGWEHLFAANRGLGIEPHVGGWNGEPIQYNEVCYTLYRLDAGLLTAGDVV